MNRMTIIGNLTHNPESRILNTQNGAKAVCNFTVAANRTVRGQKITEYFRVSCWEKQADNAMKYLAKGRKVAVTGPITARAYLGSDGEPRASLEIQWPEEIEYLSGRGDEGREPEAPPDEYSYTPKDDTKIPF